MQSIGGQTQCRGSTIRTGLGAAADVFSARTLVAGTQSQPTGEVFFGFPAGHVRADLADEFEGRVAVDPVDSRQVNARDAMYSVSQVKRRCVAMGLMSSRLVRQLGSEALVRHRTQLPLDLLVAREHLLMVRTVQCQGLPQCEQVLLAPVALQGFGNRLL